MFFFGKNLKSKHKVTLCLAVLGILLNYWVFAQMGPGYPIIEFLKNGEMNFNITKMALSFGILVKMLVIAIFRKF